MIALIGDVHGKYRHYHEIIREKERYPYTLQVGDFGFNYDTLLNVDPNHHVFMPGNHDNYDVLYDIPNCIGDYGFKSLNGVDFFFYRGAYSIDRDLRTIGIDWWEKEELSLQEFENAKEIYKDVKPDIMISHDCPQFVSFELLGPNQKIYQNMTSWALSELYNIHQPKYWFFGHWHISKKIQHGLTTFICLDELETYNLA
jgi:hypothetical protein